MKIGLKMKPFLFTAILIAVTKLISILKEVLIANKFGVSAALDLYLIALLLPSALSSVLGSAISTSFAPIYSKIVQKSKEKAKHFTLFILINSSLFLFISFLIVYIFRANFLNWIFGYSGNISELNLIFTFLLPILFFNTLSFILITLLNLNGEYYKSNISVGIIPLLIIISLFIDTSKITYVAIATTIGYSFQLIYLLYLCKGYYSIKITEVCVFKRESKEILKNIFPLIISSLILTSITFIDQTMASYLDEGAVSKLSYGSRIPGLIMSLIATVITTILFPHFTKLVANKDLKILKIQIKHITFKLLFMSTIISIIMIIFSEDIVRLLYERGNFDFKDTISVSAIQIALCLQIPFFVLTVLKTRVISALEKNNIMLWGNLISVILTIILNYVLMQYFGVLGIAYATTIVYIVSYFYITILLNMIMKKEY
jgi:putative peptidoglycan lipid II flippase